MYFNNDKTPSLQLTIQKKKIKIHEKIFNIPSRSLNSLRTGAKSEHGDISEGRKEGDIVERGRWEREKKV